MEQGRKNRGRISPSTDEVSKFKRPLMQEFPDLPGISWIEASRMLVAGQPVQIGGKDAGECPYSLVVPTNGLADPSRGGEYVLVMLIDALIRADVDHPA